MIPGIKTIDAIAADVHQQHLRITTADTERNAPEHWRSALSTPRALAATTPVR
jgi:hypothetical protein